MLRPLLKRGGVPASDGNAAGDAAYLLSLSSCVRSSLGDVLVASRFPSPSHDIHAGSFPCTIYKYSCREAMRRGFRAGGNSDLDGVLRDLQWIAEMMGRMDRTGVACSMVPSDEGRDDEGTVRTIVSSSYLGKHMRGATDTNDKYMFIYRVRIDNLSESCVQLLGRDWKIVNEEGEVEEVNAPNTGVVGHLPVIPPGRSFEYMSGVELGTTRGTMFGHFIMAVVKDSVPSAVVGDRAEALGWDENDPKRFCADVAPFPLIAEGDRLVSEKQ